MHPINPQTSVSENIETPFPGVIGDTGVKRTSARVSAESSAEIPHGHVVVRDSTNKESGAVLPHTDAATSAPLFLGIVVHTHANVRQDELGDIGLTPKTSFDTLEFGSIWVSPGEAVEPGDPVRFQATGATAGSLLKTASAGNTVDISSLARWVTAGDANTTCLVELNAMNASLATADA